MNALCSRLAGATAAAAANLTELEDGEDAHC
jgi:hypothetical protein